MHQLVANWPGAKTKGKLFGEIAREYLSTVLAHKGKAYFDNAEVIYRLHILPYLDTVECTVAGAAWPLYVAHQRRLNPTRQLTHDRKYIVAALKYAGVAVPPMPLDPRDKARTLGRELRNKEIRELIATASPNWKLKVEFQLKTGARSMERRALKWADVDLTSGLVTIQGKGHRQRYSYLDASLLKQFRAKKLKAKGSYVWPSRFDANKPEVRGDKGFQNAKRRAGLKVKLHWLRHTHLTRAVRAGEPTEMLQATRGVSPKVMRQVYLHANRADAKRQAEMVQRSMEE